MYFNLGHDTEQLLYSAFTMLGVLVVAVYNIISFNRNQKFLSALSKRKLRIIEREERTKKNTETVITTVECLIITAVYYFSGGVLSLWLGKVLATGTNYFGLLYLAQTLLLIGSYIAGLDVIRLFDRLAPTYPLGLIFSKIGCFFAGCCSGIEWENGIYNFDDEAYQVPVQLIETAFAVLIFIILFSVRKKFKPGTGFPVYLILYSGTRFFSEFLRSEPEVFAGLKFYHLLCISGVIIGITAYVIAIKYSDRISLRFTEKNPISPRLIKVLDKKYAKHKQRKIRKSISHSK